MKTMKELALSKIKSVPPKPEEKILNLPSGKLTAGGQAGVSSGTTGNAAPTSNKYHDPGSSQSWHLRMILRQQLPIDITLNNGTLIHDAHLAGFDTYSLILQDGEYRVVLLKHAVASLRFKFSEPEPNAGTH